MRLYCPVEGKKMQSISAEEAKSRLIDRVRDLAYLHSPDDLFTLASGRKSPHFFDMKPVMMDPENTL